MDRRDFMKMAAALPCVAMVPALAKAAQKTQERTRYILPHPRSPQARDPYALRYNGVFVEVGDDGVTYFVHEYEAAHHG